MKRRSPPLAASVAVGSLLTSSTALLAATVTTTDDDGPGSLRQEIANATPGDTIDFGAGLNNGLITLVSGEILLDKDLTIDASALPDGIILSGDSQSRHFRVATSHTVRLVHLALRQGQAADGSPGSPGLAAGAGAHGGAILNAGNLTLQDCELVGNRAGAGGEGGPGLAGGQGGHGGAIHSSGDLTLLNCSVRSNRAGNGGPGGAHASGAAGGAGGEAGHGGAIFNTGTLTLSGCTLSNNAAGAGGAGADDRVEPFSAGRGGRGGNGGAIFSTGPVVVSQSTLRANAGGDGGPTGNLDTPDAQSVGGDGGRAGAVYCSADLDLTGCTVSDHEVGAAGEGCSRVFTSAICGRAGEVGGIWIDTGAPSCRFEDVHLAGNDHLAVLNLGSLEVLGGTIADNEGGGIANHGGLNMEEASVSGNGSSGLVNAGTTEEPAAATLERCAIFGNSVAAGNGGGIFNGPHTTATLRNCVVADNRCEALAGFSTFGGAIREGGQGGGIANAGSLTLVNCTVASNDVFSDSVSNPFGGTIVAGATGGGIHHAEDGSLTLDNTIVAGNRRDGGPSDLHGPPFLEAGVNLVSTTAGLDDPDAFAGIVAEARLAPLGDFGGPTPSSPPLAGSPAIDAGAANALAVDQRGLPRVIDGDSDGSATIDVGAVEAQTAALVLTTADNGAGSLREAIATLTNPGSRVTFDPAVFGGAPEDVIVLEAELSVPQGAVLSVDASNIPGGVTVSGDGRVRVLKNEGSLAVTHLVIAEGQAPAVSGFLPDPVPSRGGGIWNLGTLGLDRCVVRNCAAGRGGAAFGGGHGSPGADGGGICNDGMLIMARCTVASNQAGAGGDGNAGATGSIFNVPGNGGNGGEGGSGGGICNTGMLTLTECTISGNRAGAGGSGGDGAEGNFFGPPANGGSGARSGAGGGIHNLGSLAAMACTVSSNELGAGGQVGEGAPANSFGPAGSDGTAGTHGAGGGFSNVGPLFMQNSTIAENSAGLQGEAGGLHNLAGSNAELIHVTLARNASASRAGGILNEGTLTLANSIVALNTAALSPDVHGPITSEEGLNLLSSLTGLTGPFSGLVADPLLLPLGDHGGPTLTCLPVPVSPAVDAALPAPAFTGTDQRGILRPTGGSADLGAVEQFCLVPLPFTDTDADQMNDMLEPLYGYVVGAQEGANDDDGDGSSNAEELANKTDPRNQDDFLRLLAVAPAPKSDPLGDPAFEVTWSSFPGLRYGIESDPEGRNFEPAAAEVTASDTATTQRVTLRPGRDLLRVRRR